MYLYSQTCLLHRLNGLNFSFFQLFEGQIETFQIFSIRYQIFILEQVPGPKYKKFNKCKNHPSSNHPNETSVQTFSQIKSILKPAACPKDFGNTDIIHIL